MSFTAVKNRLVTTLRTQALLRTHWAAYLFVLLFLVSGVLTLNQYGMTWDEGLGNFFFGERYLYYLKSFDPHYLDFQQDLPAMRQWSLPLFESPYHARPHEFPAFADIFSAASMHLFGYRLGWLDPVEAFHLFPVLLSAGFLLVFYHFFAARFGRFRALLALVFLGTYPRFWSDMHFNVKDVPEAVFYSLAIMGYWSWYERPGWKKALLAGALVGAALGIKANALFIPLTLLLGVWPFYDPRQWPGMLRHLRQYFGHYLLMIAASLAVYIASWPYLYADPRRLWNYYHYIGLQGGRDGGPGWKWQPIQITLATMNEVMLACFVIGLVAALAYAVRRRHFSWRLVLVWCLLPVARISLPHMVNFDGVRHFLEFLPAAALIAALGAAQIAAWIARRFPNRAAWVSGAVLALALLYSAWANLSYHPFQYLYFNRLVGGMDGAAQVFGEDEATDYWASSYRKGMAWLSAHAEMGAAVYVPVAGWLPGLTRALYLRPDIRVLTRADAAQVAGADTPYYLMTITRPFYYDDLTRAVTQNQPPVYQIQVDGRAVLVIYFISP